MRPTSADKRRVFQKLHERGCFVLPNPWDAGSARMLQRMGFQALASTSSGFAWTQGWPDYSVTRDAVLAHLRALSEAVDLPVNADFESGFAADPQGVADSVSRAIETGIAGLSIEDRDLDGGADALFDRATAVERLRAARKAIDQSGQDVILVARTEGLLIDQSALTPAIDKLAAFADAGADCLYAPGVRDRTAIATMVRAVAPKPVNVLVLDPTMTLSEFADLGVRRLSVGGALARVGWAGVMRGAEALLAGSFEDIGKGYPSQRLNESFESFLPP
jgi:2-methylisocitrate lyase-like PEP mutase family enzyme